MAEFNLRSWPEVSQVSEDLQLNSMAAKLEHILARFARLESRLVEHERRVATTLPPLQPEPDPPDAATLYIATQPWQLDCTVFSPPINHRSAVPLPAAVPQQPQLRESSFWFGMPQQHVPSSTPTFIASTISPKATTESQNCHGQPAAVLQPLLHPTSLSHSTIVSMAADVAIPPPAYFVLNEEEEEFLVTKVIGEHQDDAVAVVETNANIDKTSKKSCDVFVMHLMDEEEQLFSGSKEDSRVSGWVVQEEEKLIWQKRPLLKIMVVIMAKCGLKENHKFQKNGVGDRLQHDLYVYYHYTFDPGGNNSPKLRFSTLLVASWFPP